ncbi:MAG: 2-hydroxymuconic semialdehyde dehydrogenase [Ilumatobacter sp.]|uniref:2-hydroxymuconic semialdehyde dehydrogenase n=1 Tax=Ilumatobacter sp. TaxID=1967498 RepID=UPI00263801DC|nr:2-hydroxymuconic semialdehyde dehydrogenase [Ilumatobacter sp.]MDJ0768483.1 2-hydroxymuconic semialdehyde dehydrogenase [Ilumatobacter sp.]
MSSTSTLTAPASTATSAEFLNFINGDFRPSSTGTTFENRSPVDGSLIGMVHEASADDVDEAVRAARAARAGAWGELSMPERSALLVSVADEIDRRFDDFLAAEMLDTGKPVSIASHIDIPRGAANFRVFADLVKNVPGEHFHLATPDGLGAANLQLHKPRGVIAVVCPWNLPLLLMTWKVGPALAWGNTVVVKPSEETPATATLLGEVMNDVGVPAGVYNVVHGFGPNSTGEFLTSHPGVDGITFTGETRTGSAIMKAASDGVRAVSMEMGGKNPGIIFADADLDEAVAGTARSAFANSGQVCLGTERVYVERPIFDEFVARLAERAQAMKIGDPDQPDTELGPLISEEHRQKVLGYYRTAVDEGATVVTGGGVPDVGDAHAKGAWIEPTIWTGLADDAAVVTEEIFGPCCHIRPFDTEDEVIQLANDTEYGLAATVWTTNLSRAHRVSSRLEVGLCWVNSWFLRDLRTSFGGMKSSGIGREGGAHSTEFYTEPTNVCIKL